VVYKGDFMMGMPHGIGFMELGDCTLEGYWQKGEFVKGFLRNGAF
jgi:hypothetical protein